MKSLVEVRGRCLVGDGHWIWKGAKSAGRPNITAPDWTKKDGAMWSQRGARAVWHLKTGKPIPNGFRVFLTCDEPCCVNPAHVECRDHKEWGAEMAQSGEWRGNPNRIIASRKANLRRSPVTPALMVAIMSSPMKTGRELARELDLPHKLISRIRTGRFVSLPVSNPFAGLGA